MESQPQNPEFRNNPENFHPCLCVACFCGVSLAQTSTELVGLCSEPPEGF